MTKYLRLGFDFRNQLFFFSYEVKSTDETLSENEKNVYNVLQNI